MTGSAQEKAVFLDKDGTLVENIPYNVDPELVTLTPGAAEAIRAFSRAGYRMVVVSNQSGVARGLFTVDALEAVRERLQGLFDDLGAHLDGFYWCPHHPAGRVSEYAVLCRCRKPEPGSLWRAASELGLDLWRSWLVGDILDDIEAGRAAGTRTVLVDNGGETEWRMSPARQPHYRVPDLAAAARCILEADAMVAKRSRGRLGQEAAS